MVVAPDITLERFGFGNQERWLCTDRTRHMFSRLWWQAYLLRTPKRNNKFELLDGPPERDLNALLERTSIGGYRPLLHSLLSPASVMGSL